MQRRRVVVTGMGAVAATGIGARALWEAARDGRSGVGRVRLQREVNNRVTIAAQIPDYDPTQYFDRALLAALDPFAQYALIAADEALAEAGLAEARPLGARTAVILGTGLGGSSTLDEQHRRVYIDQKRPEPLTIPRVMANSGASHISTRHGVTGPVFAVASACASAGQAVGLGLMLIRSGAVDRAIVGGSEAMITASVFSAWEGLRVLSPDRCRPFSRKRNGMVLGEGAGMFVLEAAECAAARGAEPLAELAGYGTTADARDLLRPDPAGAAACMRAALADAGLEPGELDYINAHGTGTVANDSSEAEALRQVFGNGLARIAVSSTKPVHGHALGAGGALELLITIMALRNGVVPPTLYCEELDPACDGLDVVPNTARAKPVRAAMSNSFAFGGINAALIVTQANPH